MRVVLASSNPGKLRELGALLAPLGWKLVPQAQLGISPVEETGSTFLENALLKARHAASLAQGAALADDSGIEVDALGGRPGVWSARYAGEAASDAQNLDKLLAQMRDVAAAGRTARYRCVIVFLADAAAEPLIGEGVWEGSLLRAPRGAGGFGYDPIFLPRGSMRSAAEMSAGEKDVLSHRAQALAALQLGLRASVARPHAAP
ncbi:MAG TPA: RdgB/HAM1 family non-canonical purine NTP pyrophosphatase [Steroidobacteraceae bacterium]|nr:RdgB/HAM1 family non-canonical purine NTP pyrophosphatase [Steroidobacteraceae bacterium]